MDETPSTSTAFKLSAVKNYWYKTLSFSITLQT